MSSRYDDDHTTDVSGVVPFPIPEESTDRIVSPQRLVCVAGADLGRTFKITPPMTIGRGSVEVALRAKDVSRQHARLVSRGAKLAVEDLGSSNGTFVNGAAVAGTTQIHV